MLVNLLLLLACLVLAFAEQGSSSIPWKSVALDASGKFQVAAAGYNYNLYKGYPIYLSDDYGSNWKQSKSPALDWRNVYSDSTGQTLVAYAVYNSRISSSTPPLYVSKDRGNTWTTAAPTTNTSFVNDITGNQTTLWTVTNSNLYYSNDDAKTWYQSTNIKNKKGTGYAVIGDFSIDTTGQHRYVICDGYLCFSDNSGQSYLTGLTATSVETDPSGQYVFALTDNSLWYSINSGYIFQEIKDYTKSGSNATVVPTFLKISSDHKYIYTLEKLYSSSNGVTTTYVTRFPVDNPVSSHLLSTTYTITDVAISNNGKTILVSTSDGFLHLTTNGGTNWSGLDLSKM
eukprot:gene12740-13955_t